MITGWSTSVSRCTGTRPCIPSRLTGRIIMASPYRVQEWLAAAVGRADLLEPA
jgi:hypothetical protein